VVDRLNVVLVSRSGLGVKSENMIESIVGNLAGRSGIDLVLVSPLAEIDRDSTDQLTLSSIRTSAVVLTWTSPEQTMSDLERIGFTGVRSPHAIDPFHKSANAFQETGRKIYAINLCEVIAVDDLLNQLDRLRTIQSVKTFSLGAASLSSSRSKAPIQSQPQQSKVENKPVNESQSFPQDQGFSQTRESQAQSNVSDAGLDDLIDQLDDFDA
jgi:hypothetical protein